MKKNFVRSSLLIAGLFLCLQSPAQVIVSGFAISGGEGVGCNAAKTTSGQVPTIALPFPEGIKLSQLTELSTKFRGCNAEIELEMLVTVTGGTVIQFYYYNINAPSWNETGNLLSTATSISGGPASSLAEVLQLYGDATINNITLRATHDHGCGGTWIDDTWVNNILLNYDDCDDDGMLDYYDCDPSVPQGQKTKICHNGNTICINVNALNAHLAHGDYQGPCTTPAAVPIELPTEESPKQGFKIYPNPATDQVTIQNNDNKKLGTVTIYDISGKMIYQKLISSSWAIIDVKSFSPGVYYLRSDQIGTAIKFIKQ